LCFTDGAIFATVLGGVQGLIGTLDEGLDRIAAPQDTDANADRERDGVMRVLLVNGIPGAGHCLTDGARFFYPLA